MAGATAVANNGGPTAIPPVMQAAAEARATGAKTRTTRTSIPTQSGKWILGKTIGAGSMGKVKLARKEDGVEQVSHFPSSLSPLLPLSPPFPPFLVSLFSFFPSRNDPKRVRKKH